MATAVFAVAWAVLLTSPGGPERAVQLVLVVVPLGLGWLLAVRAPASPVAGALAWLAALMVATPVVELRLPVFGAGAWPWQVVGFMVLLLVFPDGLLPGRWWRAVAVCVPGSALLVQAAFLVTMNHHDEPHARSPVTVPEAVWLPVMFAALGVLLAVVVACLAGVVVRYRRGGERTRQQLRWLILAAGSVVLLMVGSWAVNTLAGPHPWAYATFLVGIVLLVPAAVTVAILRHDLFEIDRILSDSVAWVLTMAAAAAALAVLIVGVGYVAGRDSEAGLTGAVFVVAVLLLPLHRRLHDLVGRVLDRDRTVLVARIGRFVERVRDGSAEPEQVEAVLREAVGDPGLVLRLTEVDGGGHVDLSGTVAAAPEGIHVPLRTADTQIGVLVVSPGSARRVRRARLAASAARLPIEVSRLRLGLRRAVQDVADSRRRLMYAVVDERRRLERDLHDGAQQELVAVGMQLRAAQRRLPAGDPVAAELDEAVARLAGTVGTLRRLAHGVRPASLDDGLPAALARLAADCPLPVHLDVAADEVPEVVAVTAYFVVAEATTNVLKHARAGEVRVTVRRSGDGLTIRVADDGVGGAPTGSGLTALRDRVASIGGTLAVASPDGAGTTVEVVLPCAS